MDILGKDHVERMVRGTAIRLINSKEADNG
jgi:hypothetical protein